MLYFDSGFRTIWLSHIEQEQSSPREKVTFLSLPREGRGGAYTANTSISTFSSP